MKGGQAFHVSPYVVQMEKYVHSVKELSRKFLELEEKQKGLTSEELERMFQEVRSGVCKECEKYEWCWGENFVHTYQLGYEIFSAIENYGNELNVEVKRKLQKCCVKAPRFLRGMLDVFRNAKRNILWRNRMVQSRKGCAMQINAFADMLEMTSKEMEDSIYTDERKEKQIAATLKKAEIRVLRITFFLTQDGRHKIWLIARAMDGGIPVKEVGECLSEIMGKRMVPDKEQGQVLGKEYVPLLFLEGPAFYTMQGLARIGKGCNKISGDSFMLLGLPDGKSAAALSDGMGAGEEARRESELVTDLLEELLGSGFPPKTAVQMINTALVMGREELRFSTVDMTIFDLYTGSCEIIKAGASSTFLKRKGSVEHLFSASLPIGVLNKVEIDSAVRTLSDGDFVIMVTDGILDALPVGEQDLILETIIQGTEKQNPKEMAHYILEQVLSWTGEEPMDDMTVLVIGIWKQ